MIKENRVVKKFAECRTNNKKLLIPYIMAGDPDIDTTVELVLAMEREGADLIELGVPFSDPLADGPVIQKAGLRSLKNNVNINAVFQVVKKIREHSQIPVILMSYFNPIFNYNLQSFAKEAQNAGVDGVIVPDLPFDEDGEFYESCINHEIALISLISPTSSGERIKAIGERASSFIYCIPITGTTGVRESVSNNLQEFMNQVRKYTDKPLAVGFGIGTEEHARKTAEFSDAVIVGSALVSIIEEHNSAPNVAVDKIKEKIRGFKRAIS